MCVPAIGAVVGAAVGIAGLGMQAVAQKRAIDAENKAAEYNAQVAERNVEMVQAEATQAREAGRQEEEELRQRVRQLRGSQRAGFAASGVLVDQGSSLDVLEETAHFGELDALALRQNLALEQRGYQIQQVNYGSQAQMLRKTKRSAGLAVGSTLLSGATNLATRYMR